MTCAVLLDLDGTLIDSHPGISASCLAALRALGHEPNETLDIRSTIGLPLEDVLQLLLRSHGDDRVVEAVAAYRRHYGETGVLGSVPYPGIGEALEEMKRSGLRLYLATSKRAIFASRILDHLRFAAYFDGIDGSVPTGELDHKPELLAHILSKHRLSRLGGVTAGFRCLFFLRLSGELFDAALKTSPLAEPLLQASLAAFDEVAVAGFKVHPRDFLSH
jgi:phosphoglycolate phosphatase